MDQGHRTGWPSHLQEPERSRSGKEKCTEHSISGSGMELGTSPRLSGMELHISHRFELGTEVGTSHRLSGMELGMPHRFELGMEVGTSHRLSGMELGMSHRFELSTEPRLSQ